ncbi:MAG: lipoate--protein ligase [Clostridiales bacterium]|nr:lipoate--protein ligase [Clostridiales bacterium]MDU3243095.1 lipoate--protein ligase [Clostridiales bacterium]
MNRIDGILYVESPFTDPCKNLALEEYFFYHKTAGYPDADMLILWQNENSIIIGKHQNTLEEINEEAVEKYGTKVVRRNTGGGTVFHDLGNLNFSFITTENEDMDISYERFLEPVIGALKTLGVPAVKSGRNDITADGKKISGNAQAQHQNRILHHGTLLFCADLAKATELLKVSQDKLSSKGVKSVKSRIGNIIDFLDEPGMNVLQFRDYLRTYLETEAGGITKVEITPGILAETEELALHKYGSRDWNYGRSPMFNHRKEKRFVNGKVTVEMLIKKGMITACKISGDFLSLCPASDIEDMLIGLEYRRETVEGVLEHVPLVKYFGKITKDELMECFY